MDAYLLVNIEFLTVRCYRYVYRPFEYIIVPRLGNNTIRHIGGGGVEKHDHKITFSGDSHTKRSEIACAE